MAAGSQTRVQRPHSRQASALRTTALPPLIANTASGHTCTQAPQPVQASASTTTRALAVAVAVLPSSAAWPAVPALASSSLPCRRPYVQSSSPSPDVSAPYVETAALSSLRPSRPQPVSRAPALTTPAAARKPLRVYRGRESACSPWVSAHRFEPSQGTGGVGLRLGAWRRPGTTRGAVASRQLAGHGDEPAQMQRGVDADPRGHDDAAPVVHDLPDARADPEDDRLTGGRHAHGRLGEQAQEAGHGDEEKGNAGDHVDPVVDLRSLHRHPRASSWNAVRGHRRWRTVIHRPADVLKEE